MYYAHIDNENNIIDFSEAQYLNFINIQVTQEQYELAQEKGNNYFIYSDGELILNPNYEEEQEEKERERIGELQITKRVFMLGLQQMGITYSQLKALIATNEQAQLEWDLCVELQRKNPLLDIMAAQLGVSSEMLDYIFRKANGEDVDPPESEE